MSGGTLGVAALIGGAFVACGQVAAGAATIAVQGGIATYEQFVIAKECGEAVKALETETKNIAMRYRLQSERVIEQLATSENVEIAKLKQKLRRLGVAESELSLSGSTEIQLVKLMELYDKRINKFPKEKTSISLTRTPQQIYKNIAEIINPIIAEMPENTRLYRLLFNYLMSSESVALSNKEMNEKIAELKKTEQFLIQHIDEYSAIVKSNRYLKEEYIGCTIALKKLAEAVGKRVIVEEFDLSKAHQQIEDAKKQCAEMRDEARKHFLNDERAIAANREMAKLIIQAIENSGSTKLVENEKAYGIESVHSFGNSLIKATTSKDGTVSINLVGKDDESDAQIKTDELRFCQETLDNIVAEMKRLGVEFDIASREYLNSETIYRLNITDIEDDSSSGNLPRRNHNSNTLAVG